MTPGDPKNRTSECPAKRRDIVVHELDGEAVLYDERSGAVHRFNETALTVWKTCDGSRRVSEISRVLVECYALCPSEARTEVEAVIHDLDSKGLLLEMPEPATKPTSRLPSRRDVLCGGTAKLIYAAPLISTFFASGACASGPSASGAFGAGCKEVGYSCTINGDCCQNPTKTKCQNSGPQTGTCCIQHNESPCTLDTQCCLAGDTCVATVCQ